MPFELRTVGGEICDGFQEVRMVTLEEFSETVARAFSDER